MSLTTLSLITQIAVLFLLKFKNKTKQNTFSLNKINNKILIKYFLFICHFRLLCLFLLLKNQISIFLFLSSTFIAIIITLFFALYFYINLSVNKKHSLFHLLFCIFSLDHAVVHVKLSSQKTCQTQLPLCLALLFFT